MEVTIQGSNGRICEAVYGQFIEHILTCIEGGVYDPESPFADSDGVRTDVCRMAQEMAPPVLRFPGGTVMCQYHWEDAVGPQETRIRRKNLIWGGELDPSFGTAEFVQFCRKIGTEPMICVNMASGTPEEAGNWVEYCNGTGNSYYANLRRSHGFAEPFGVKYWCIGNESYAEPDIGVHHDVNLYIRDAMEFIKFMKLTDRSIRTVVVGCGQPEWDEPVLKALHAVTDYFSLHHYSAENHKGLYGPFEGERQLIDMLEQTAKRLDAYPEKVTDFSPWYRFPPRAGKIQIALDEWNIWNFAADETYGLLERYCWRDAVWTASVLNDILNQPAVGIANLAQMVNVIAPVVAEKEGAWYQTIAYPFLLYRREMLGERLQLNWEPLWLDGGEAGKLEALNLCAVRGEDGVVRVAAVNRDFEKEHVISLGEGEATMVSLTADSPSAICSREQCCVQRTERAVSCSQIVLRPGSVNLISLKSV